MRILEYLETGMTFYEDNRMIVQEQGEMIKERDALLAIAKEKVFDRARETDLWDNTIVKILKAKIAGCPFSKGEIRAILGTILYGNVGGE